jgi:FkbM family methyltransferase
MKYLSQDLSVFLNYTKYVANFDDIKIIFDVGSCHCLEAVEFSKLFKNSKIYCFEANPTTIKNCLTNSNPYPAITVTNIAINDFDGICKFYPINIDKTRTSWKDGNQGASSLYISNGEYDHIEKYVQNEIEIECIRLDTFSKINNIDKIDIIWMDLQGAELKALISLGDLLDNIKIIHTELEINPIYNGQCLFNEVNDFLFKRSFFLRT